MLDEKALAELGYGGILGGRRRARTRRRGWSELTYAPDGRRRTHVALVGKGITFDSGGLTIKPAQGMDEMKSDMAGAAAVVAATLAIAELEPAGRGHGVRCRWPRTWSPASAIRPGDVLTMYGGKTVEVLNTDAEGRLILADALVPGRARTKPDVISTSPP